ncbi:hypothetical protein Bca52824_043871 [Brassica carinata]|uniref:Uncharacterized protein n=1 Tax=Brassica carinata TaxID=52824 RepID=A0A8X7RZZ5_BRACI|nr:hypothetical protein Bca52824_043871 [Brassica carinata]
MFRMESYDLHKVSIMTQCIDGVKHLCTSVLGCFDLNLFKQSGGGLGDPELLSRDTGEKTAKQVIISTVPTLSILNDHRRYRHNISSSSHLSNSAASPSDLLLLCSDPL